ncbi:MAG: cupin domain-containing protein [Candidatus Rokubacteria bacterium]|nr:cupin domain-containing protein [Candidatus Rokubacteria bacterium]
MSGWSPQLKREGEITRRHLFENEVVQVDEVTFSSGASPGVHSHDVPGARYVLEGEILFQEADGRRWTAKAGEVYWERGGITHYTKNVSSGKLRLLEVLLKPR